MNTKRVRGDGCGASEAIATLPPSPFAVSWKPAATAGRGITNGRSSALANPGGPVAGDAIALKLQGNGNLTSSPAGAAMSVINPTAGHVIGIPRSMACGFSPTKSRRCER